MTKTKNFIFWLLVVVVVVIVSAADDKYVSSSSLRRLLSDPKTVEGKPHEKLRFLFFGTSRTYGMELQERIESGFPNLVHPDSVNLAIGGSNPAYPSICLHSMLKAKGLEGDNDSFDVIVLEYDDAFFEVILGLVERLKQRFPYSKVIIIDVFILVNFQHIPTSQNLRTVYQASDSFDRYALNSPLTSKDRSILVNLVETMGGEQDWKMDESQTFTPEQEEAFLHHGAIVLRPIHANTVLDAIQLLGECFVADMSHYSEAGHAKIANAILQHLKESGVRTHHDFNVRDWDAKDQCESWYKTGITSVQYNPSQFKMEEFSQKHKYGLAMQTDDVASITMNNPLDTAAKLSLEYMVTSPLCDYPDVVVTIENNNTPPVVIKCQQLHYSMQVHITMVKWIGLVEPGDFTVTFHRTRENEDSQEERSNPFRVVGYVLAKPEESSTNRDVSFNNMENRDFKLL